MAFVKKIARHFILLSAYFGLMLCESVAIRPAKAIVASEFSFNGNTSIDSDPIFDKIVENHQRFNFDILFGGMDGMAAAYFTGVQFDTNYDAAEVKADAVANIVFSNFIDNAGITFNGGNNNSACAGISFNPCTIFLPFQAVNPFNNGVANQVIATVELTSKITKNDGIKDIWLTNTKWFTVAAYGASNNAQFEIQPVPGPLPLLGLGAAFGYSRKLRKRLNSKKTPVLMNSIN